MYQPGCLTGMIKLPWFPTMPLRMGLGERILMSESMLTRKNRSERLRINFFLLQLFSFCALLPAISMNQWILWTGLQNQGCWSNRQVKYIVSVGRAGQGLVGAFGVRVHFHNKQTGVPLPTFDDTLEQTLYLSRAPMPYIFCRTLPCRVGTVCVITIGDILEWGWAFWYQYFIIGIQPLLLTAVPLCRRCILHCRWNPIESRPLTRTWSCRCAWLRWLPLGHSCGLLSLSTSPHYYHGSHPKDWNARMLRRNRINRDILYKARIKRACTSLALASPHKFNTCYKVMKFLSILVAATLALASGTMGSPAPSTLPSFRCEGYFWYYVQITWLIRNRRSSCGRSRPRMCSEASRYSVLTLTFSCNVWLCTT